MENRTKLQRFYATHTHPLLVIYQLEALQFSFSFHRHYFVQMQKRINNFNNFKGDSIIRPQSELKVSTPIEKPALAPLSAPPNVAEQAKMEGIDRFLLSTKNSF